MKKLLTAALFSVSCVIAAPVSAIDDLHEYKGGASGVSGNLSSVGSDTMNNLMTLWAEEFKKFYPNVNIQIQGAGSSTAPPALTEGTAHTGPMSRSMKPGEIEAFEKKFGYPPTEVRVAIDALAVYVHKDNPLDGLTIQQVDAIFSSTRKCGGAEDIIKWGQVGLKGSLAEQSIQLFGRNSVSGTYGYFKEHALCKGDFKNNVNEQPGSASVVQSISASLNGIGYSGIGYLTSGVKVLAISPKTGASTVPALVGDGADKYKNVISGTYPLSRFLYVYVNKDPSKPLSPLVKEFLTMMLSKEGQAVVQKDGYVPLPISVVEKELAKLK
ncbi:PstS family phosphate ABC transporter substrate-binding protein [Beggiatoa leptomitoformis]|uniref:Phosphate-binding protein n=1 Tax=Beggiatoa leptomitoformis TaxID=288004 RepID=A0A2N9YDR4_9GAMM|nr:PstS family phosphate ABC transporter substrate-binding protein [Beggiatoa leptomitoformis]ALG69007.1 phosphate ABC transporter substrate-binding protein PstS family protein [Beggiatoa leptomitoformis]AUI68596.1 phosphate ABC transporter substrate-binding protein PstS family protein [Beggiatoa leptomitoformis]